MELSRLIDLAKEMREQGIKNGWSDSFRTWEDLTQARRDKWIALARLAASWFGQ